MAICEFFVLARSKETRSVCVGKSTKETGRCIAVTALKHMVEAETLSVLKYGREAS